MDISFFWKTFNELCEKAKKSPNAVCKELGFSTATATHWKNNKKPSWASLKKIAEYFDVSVDYLLGEENKKNASDIFGDIADIFGDSVSDTLRMFVALDAEDRGFIRGEITQMLRSNKYSDIIKKA